MSTPDYGGLSEQLRIYYENLSPEVRDRFLTVIQQTFNVQNRRNAQLWVTRAGVQRSFINRSTPPLELEMREAFVKGLIGNPSPNAPEKVTDLGVNPVRVGAKLRQYLAEDFTREYCIQILFLPDQTLYVYEASSSSFDEIPDDASDEFADIPTDPFQDG